MPIGLHLRKINILSFFVSLFLGVARVVLAGSLINFRVSMPGVRFSILLPKSFRVGYLEWTRNDRNKWCLSSMQERPAEDWDTRVGFSQAPPANVNNK
jgi:hypothetical protein